MKNAQSIEGSPLSISVYSVKSTPTELCCISKYEIILCLKGSVNVSYIYRHVTLHAGEFVSINHDAYYMSSDEENICVSFYIDTQRYKDSYPDIMYRHHVCVGAYSDLYTPRMGYPTAETDNMLGMLLVLLYHYTEGSSVANINEVTDMILESLIEEFDVIYFLNGNKDIKDEVHDNLVKASSYVYKYYDEKYTHERLGELLGISPNYVNEYLRKAGMDIKELRNFAKIYAAERMLTETDKTVLEISEDVGFSSLRQMYQAFSLCLGCAPGRFRNIFYKKRESVIEYHEPDILKDILEKEMISHFLKYFGKNR